MAVTKANHCMHCEEDYGEGECTEYLDYLSDSGFYFQLETTCKHPLTVLVSSITINCSFMHRCREARMLILNNSAKPKILFNKNLVVHSLLM